VIQEYFLLIIPHFLAFWEEVHSGWIYSKYCSEPIFGDWLILRSEDHCFYAYFR